MVDGSGGGKVRRYSRPGAPIQEPRGNSEMLGQCHGPFTFANGPSSEVMLLPGKHQPVEAYSGLGEKLPSTSRRKPGKIAATGELAQNQELLLYLRKMQIILLEEAIQLAFSQRTRNEPPSGICL